MLFRSPRTGNVHKLAALYAQATAFVNPTWQDNYPTVNLEAIACGTPVVTYRTGGSVESITPETGFVVEQGDVEGMLEKVREIASASREDYWISENTSSIASILADTWTTSTSSTLTSGNYSTSNCR